MEIFGIPLIGYFDDFSAPAPKNLGRRAIRTFGGFFPTLGMELKTAHADRCQKIICLGLIGGFPTHENNMPPQNQAAGWKGIHLGRDDVAQHIGRRHNVRRTGIAHRETPSRELPYAEGLSGGRWPPVDPKPPVGGL